MMKKEKNKRVKTIVWSTAAVLSLFFIFGVFSVVKALISDDDKKKKRRMHMVQLMKPPPPPKVKEKPPEPKIEKKQEIVEPEQKAPEPEPTNEPTDDEPPPGDDLGLDTDGTGGADGFGLKARKGGRSLIGGGGGKDALMRKYGWYTRIIQDELRKQINKYMDDNGGIPEGDLNAVIQIKLDDMGRIIKFNVFRPAGHQSMDKAVEHVLTIARISEPPPKHMPRTIKLKIAAKG